VPATATASSRMPFTSVSMSGGGAAQRAHVVASAKSYDAFDEFFDGPQLKPKPTGLLPAGAAASRAPPPRRQLGEPMKLSAGVTALGHGMSQMTSLLIHVSCLSLYSTVGSTMGTMATACPLRALHVVVESVQVGRL
jgi:hypothetical protein